jgi:hypothetical protein
MLTTAEDVQLRQIATTFTPAALEPLPSSPLVSVLMANYNYARFLRRSVGSVLGQSYPNFEVLICDDGSTDDSAQVLRQLSASDPRVRWIQQTNQGMAAALNAAYGLARGHVVALLDADDVWLPERLASTVRAFMGNSSAGMVVHPVRAQDSSGRVVKARHPWRSDLGWLGPAIVRGEEPRLPPCSGISLHGQVAELVFPLPREFRSWADRIVQERAALLAPVAGIDEVQAIYQLHGSNLTGLAGPSTIDELKKVHDLYRRVWAARSEFLARRWAVEIPPGAWDATEGAHLNLARQALGGHQMPAEVRARITSRSKRFGWGVIFALPSALVSPALRFWWGEHSVKRVARAILGGSH